MSFWISFFWHVTIIVHTKNGKLLLHTMWQNIKIILISEIVFFHSKNILNENTKVLNISYEPKNHWKFDDFPQNSRLESAN
jgi:hypothetical protein